MHPEVSKESDKESESQVLESFRALLRLRGALFRGFWGARPPRRLFRDSFRTLPGLRARDSVRGEADPKLRRPDRSFRLDVLRDCRPKSSSLGCFFVPENFSGVSGLSRSRSPNQDCFPERPPLKPFDCGKLAQLQIQNSK